MKRLATALAAAALGTGCYNPPPLAGSVDLFWSFQRTAPAQASGTIDYDTTFSGPPNGNCVQSAVETIVVDTPVGQMQSTCVNPAGAQALGVDGVPSGNQVFEIRGYRGQVLVYDSGPVTLQVYGDTSSGNPTQYDVTLFGVPAPLDMFAYLYFGPSPGTQYTSCAAAIPAGSSAPPNLAFTVQDLYGNLIDSGAAPCSDPQPAAVFSGNLDMDNFDVRMQGLRVEDSAIVFDSCWSRLDHFGADTGAAGFAPTLWTGPVPICGPPPP